jgi:hypothetical protein
VLILLAPSEGKTAAPAGNPPADLAALAFPQLGERRAMLAERLARLSAGPQRKALAALGLSPGQAAELERNAELLKAPAAPAGEVYTGVLYQHLDLPSLPKAARARAAQRLYVASALWGVVGIDDRIPAYRLSIGAKLPRVPKGLAAWWRPHLVRALPDDAFVVDLRSGGYAAAWRPPHGIVLEVRSTGMTHMVKAVRGRVARHLVQSTVAAEDPQAVAAVVEQAGERVALLAPARPGGPWVLDVG